MLNKKVLTILVIMFLFIQINIAFSQQEEIVKEDFQLDNLLILFILFLLISSGLIALGLLVNIYFPKFLSNVTEYSINAPGKSLLLGLGNGISIFALLILLAQFEGNLIQILILPLLLVGIIGCLIGIFAEAPLIGRKILEYKYVETPSIVISVMTGFALIAFGSIVPIIGQLALLLIILKGFGAVIGSIFHNR